MELSELKGSKDFQKLNSHLFKNDSTTKNVVKCKSKYNNKKTKVDNINFDSKKEAERYKDLKYLQQFGRVTHFFRQVMVDLPGDIIYKLDFVVFWADGSITYEDVKGFKTEVYKIKKKLVEKSLPIKITEI